MGLINVLGTRAPDYLHIMRNSYLKIAGKNKYDSQKIGMISIKYKETIYIRYCKIYTDGSTDNPQVP
jgi:hypothetical protein